MTSRPSAFDALMSNERLLAAKKNPSAPSPTKKPKSLLSSRPPAKYQGNAIDGLENSIEDSPKPNSNETQKPPDSKKTKVVGISERTAELKAKIGSRRILILKRWEKGARVPFLFLCLASDLMSNETSQILITGIGCNMLRTVIYTTPDDLLAMAYLAANKLAPTHEGWVMVKGQGKVNVEEAAKIVKQVFSVLPVYDKVVPALLTSGIWNLPKTCSFTVGVPVEPMKAKSTNSVAKIVNKFQDADIVCEYKYDGERAQSRYKVEMLSGTLESFRMLLLQFLVSARWRFDIHKSSVKSFVLDCELVAYDRILSTRARKNVLLSDIKVDVCIFAFDILYLNGQALLQEQLEIRKEEIQSFLNSAVSSSCGGLMIKTLDRNAKYEPSKLSLNWLKLKKDYLERNIGDTLDLVPVAAFHGKRTGVCGSFLLACYDDNNEEYHGICKIGIGFTEAVCEECSANLRSKVIPEPKSYYHYTGEMPDVWFEAAESKLLWCMESSEEWFVCQLAMTLVRRLSSFFHNKVLWDVYAPTLPHDREKHRFFTGDMIQKVIMNSQFF
ncbi:hypothetical protein CXB51_020464 [Gossypium anomalum]|uniref:ATP-dependent DNA ligase family profile domain-containing protein n=1 Tax=Gossypium anomalum TaxID=47600 RepID=A0A8J5YD38_9ROSI|nr:hypothetical protein CXB51_020464 [Gossypium anomalum]